MKPEEAPRARHVGALIAAAALAAVVLGVVGYRQWAPDRRFTEHLYRSLQLFIFYVEREGSAPGSSPPATLDIARFLAPAAAAAASIRALVALFGERAARVWVRYFVRDHVVVGGLGQIGVRLAVAFKHAGHRVVAVEADENAPAVADCRVHGVVVLTGDPTDADLLFRAGVQKARYLVVASDDDGTNAGIALAARRVGRQRRRALPGFVHIAHPALANLLVEGTLATSAGGPLRLEYFNVWETVPPTVLDECPPGGDMLVVGTGLLGQALVAHAARRWAAQPAVPGSKLRATLAGAGAGDAALNLAGLYPRLDRVCDLTVQDVSVESAAFERVAEGSREATSVYVAIQDDDAQALQAALTLSPPPRRPRSSC